MARINTKAGICNLALSFLKAGVITDLANPVTKIDRECDLWYDETRLDVLRSHTWNFAQKRGKLAANPLFVPSFEYTTAYKLPNDFVRLNSIGRFEDIRLYQLEQGHLLINGTSTTGDIEQLPLVYIYDHQTVVSWDPSFIKLLALHLASNMAYGLTGTASHEERLENKIRKQESLAMAIDGQERPPERIERSRFLAARRGNVSGSNSKDDRTDLIIFDES